MIRNLVALLVLLTLSAACFKRGVTPIRTHFNKGVYHDSKGDFDAAASEYRMALEEDASDVEARFNLASALESEATLLERAADAQRAAEFRREAAGHYRAILAAEPHHLRASVNLAANERRAGDEATAEARLRATLERHREAALPKIALAAHRLGRGDPASLAEAVALLEEALERDRKNVDALALLGEAHARLAALEPDAEAEHMARAREAFERALDQRPGDAGVLLALGRLERRDGRPDRASSYLRRALYVRDDLLEAHLALAEILIADGDLEDAVAHLWRARELEDPRAPRLAPEAYRERLVELYRRLAEREGG